MPWLPASVAGHLRPCIRVLASPIVIARVLTPSGLTVLLLRLEVPPVVPLPLGTPLLVEVIVPLLHRSFYIDCSVVEVNIGGILLYQYSFFDRQVQSGLKPIHLQPFISYKGWGKSFHKFRGVLEDAHAPLLYLHEFALLGLLEGDRVEMILDHLLEFFPAKPRLILPLSHRSSP